MASHRWLSMMIGLCMIKLCQSWPDGAPCLVTSFESMNPLEAQEHQGGLLLTPPPYTIEVSSECYLKSEPVTLTLRGNTSFEHFRGFVIQPISYKGPRSGRRIGQFVRLDDNGSWQQQCFRFRDSATHSHDEKKNRLKLWWRVEDDQDYVQFVATVVESLQRFWVKSVVSVPIPPCRLDSRMVGFQASAPTMPPPVKSFKASWSPYQQPPQAGDRGRQFHRRQRRDIASSSSSSSSSFFFSASHGRPFFGLFYFQIPFIASSTTPPPPLIVPLPSPPPQSPSFAPPPSSISFAPLSPPRPFRPPSRPEQRLTHVIPVSQLLPVSRNSAPFTSSMVDQQIRSRPVQPRPVFRPNQPSTRNIGTFSSSEGCFDREPANCQAWIRHCATNLDYLNQNCRRTCRLC